jgi:DNA-directed RNA polymerase specialized sigma24 family protein
MPTTTHRPQATTGRAARMDHIYRTHSRYVASRIRDLLRPADVQEVQDLTQVVMLRVWRWLDTQTDPDRLTAWLRTIAARVVADYYRRDRHPRRSPLPAPPCGTRSCQRRTISPAASGGARR